MTFCTDVLAPDTMCTSTSRRTPDHADGLSHAVLVVDHEGLGQHVDDLAVLGQVDGPGGVHRALHVGLVHLAVLAGDGHHPAAVDSADVAASHPHVDARHLDAGHAPRPG